MHRGTGDYRPLRDLDQVSAASWKRFFVILAGKTNGAHLAIVTKLQSAGQTMVNTPEESDYLLVFCPIASRVGTDINEALESVPGAKPIILVVMHHTFNPEHIVAESRRQVNNQNVRLTVDCLFHEGKLLACKRNDIVLFDIKKFLGVSASQFYFWQTWKNLWNWLCDYRRLVGVGVAVMVIVLISRSERAVTNTTEG